MGEKSQRMKHWQQNEIHWRNLQDNIWTEILISMTAETFGKDAREAGLENRRDFEWSVKMKDGYASWVNSRQATLFFAISYD